MDRIGIGIIGWGFMGRTHTLCVRSLPLFYPDAGFTARLVGVCSRTVGKAEKARDELGWQAEYDLDRMCADSWRWQSSNPNGYES